MTPEERKEYYRKNREARLAYQKRYYALYKEAIREKTVDNDGRHHFFDSERLARVIFDAEDIVLTKEDIENNFKVLPIPGFSRYVCTSYGAVYCIDPPKRGKNAGSCYLVHENLQGGKPYVTLYKKDGSSLRRRVSWVVDQTWG